MTKTVGTILMILICSLFMSSDALQPFSNIILGLVWGIYDVITVKISNWNSVVDTLETPLSTVPTNPEQDFGIGQIFPLVMGLQLIMAFLDAISGTLLVWSSLSSLTKLQ
jgi:hypothetical protein